MRKAVTIFVVLTMIFSLVGCNAVSAVSGSSGSGWITTNDYTKDTVEKTWTFKNMNAMPEALDNSRIYTYDDVRSAVEKNETITDEYSELFYNYLDMMEKTHPNMNLFCFYKNMETLKFSPETEEDMKIIFGDSVSGMYKASKNKLYFNSEWENDVEYLFYHELSHAVTNYWAEWKGYSVYFDFDKHGQSVAVKEGLNSIFLESIIGYTIDGMSYQIPANHLRILLEYTDHTLEEILEHDSWYFENILSEMFEDIGSGTYNASLVNQMIDANFYSENDRYDLEKDYADYYTGILYFRNNIKQNMTKEEIIDVYETLVNRLVDNVVSGSTTDIHEFNDLQDALFEVLDEMNISDIPLTSELTSVYEYPKKSI